jgi:hypothetical protein
MVSNVQKSEDSMNQIFEGRSRFKKGLRIVHVNVENIIVHRETFMNIFESEIVDNCSIRNIFKTIDILCLIYD